MTTQCQQAPTTSSSASQKRPLHHHQPFHQLLASWPSANAIPMRIALTTHFNLVMLCASAELVWKETVSSFRMSVETRNEAALILTSARRELTTARASKTSSAITSSAHLTASSTSDAVDQPSAILWPAACQSARTTTPAPAQRATAVMAWASEDASISTSATTEATCAIQLPSAST